MEIFTTKANLSEYLSFKRSSHKTIGFVATMGALHNGHLALINISKSQSDVTVCSIFVNPTQFNDPKDLEKYPRPIEADIEKLTKSGCDVLFSPSVDEMYEPDEKWHLNLGEIEHILEGKFRPGHYQGVTQIVKKLFDAVKPDLAYFGQKDFQQFKVIEKMTEMLHIPLRLVMCPIIREENGLAMSSRNIHLSPEEVKTALNIFKTLNAINQGFAEKDMEELRNDALSFLSKCEGIKLEYMELCYAENLLPATEKNHHTIVALIAAWVGKTRLIDNIVLQ